MAKVFIYEFVEFRINFGLDRLTERGGGLVDDAFSSSVLFLFTGVGLYWRVYL